MFRIFFALILITISATTSFAESGNLSIDVVLSPAGSFKAQTNKVSGYAIKTPNGFKSDNVVIDLTNLTTGISLRDKHTKERLMVDKYPKAKLIRALGKNGTGKAEIMLKGKKVKVTGTYEESDNQLLAKFDMKLSDLNIKNVNYMGIGVKDTVTVNLSLPIKSK